ncbi:MAG: isoprenyl transferase [Ruminococcaceae bacterium]|nr:isoprenyl transferase [Oscillospiraceae bacterium]
MQLFKNKNIKAKVDKNALPAHIAIIMDGNGRWAQKRGLPRTAGHAAGAETFRTIATYLKDIGVKYMTVYAFSTENWKRSQEEVSAIMSLLENYLYEAIEKMEEDNINLTFFGDTTPLSDKLRSLIERTNDISARIDGFKVNVCLNYGGRDEIVHAAKEYMKAGGDPEQLTEEVFSNYLYSAGVPDPELIIRPSGEYRISNFLLWQCAYSEMYFTDRFWPDFTGADIDRAIEWYQGRSRRFGGVK